ncbi:unnamed protein product [Ascophyllum nodosum]
MSTRLKEDRSEEGKEHAKDIAELMRLKGTDPEAFNTYVQMAADAANLASEQPEIFKALMQDKGLDPHLSDGGGRASPAWVHQRRALHAASQLSGPDGGEDYYGMRTSPETQHPWIVISPKPGFVIKTRLLDEGIKVFVNVCHHERIGDSGLVKKLDRDGNEVEGLNIPMSVGPPWVDKDKTGEECIVYDVIINTKAIEDCRSDRTGARRDWLCHLAMQSVMTKHACKLDPKYKLPKLKFKGDKETGPAPQRIRDDSNKPRISELTQNGGSPSPSPKAPTSNSAANAENRRVTMKKSTSNKRTASTPALTALKATITTALWKRSSRGETEREIDVSTELLEETVRSSAEQWPDSLKVAVGGFRQGALSPDVLAEVEVQISAYEVIVQARGYQPFQQRLPYAVLPNSASAEANCHQGNLVISILVDKVPTWRGPDPGSKPWLLAYALGDANGQHVSAAEVHMHCEKISEQPQVSTREYEKATGETDGEILAEDRFHLKPPRGFHPHSGSECDEGDADADDNRRDEVETPICEGDELPEDEFHKADIVSQHVIDTRERQRREKIQYSEKEREARRKQPQTGLEFIDFDDYRSVGKLDGQSTPNPVESTNGQHDSLYEGTTPCQDISTAARVLSDAVTKQDTSDADVGNRLSALAWTELLD